jgi:16S rRNA (uracil1498-N3)-methyltransferase
VVERAPRIYHPQRLGADERYTLTGDQHRHLSRVLRLKAGAELTLFDGRGGEYAATIVRRDHRRGAAGGLASSDRRLPGCGQ